MTKTTDDSVLQIQQRRSSHMKRSRDTHVEQTSRWPHAPYATHSRASAHTAQLSSISLFQTIDRRLRNWRSIGDDRSRDLESKLTEDRYELGTSLSVYLRPYICVCVYNFFLCLFRKWSGLIFDAGKEFGFF